MMPAERACGRRPELGQERADRRRRRLARRGSAGGDLGARRSAWGRTAGFMPISANHR